MSDNKTTIPEYHLFYKNFMVDHRKILKVSEDLRGPTDVCVLKGEYIIVSIKTSLPSKSENGSSLKGLLKKSRVLFLLPDFGVSQENHTSLVRLLSLCKTPLHFYTKRTYIEFCVRSLETRYPKCKRRNK